MEQMCISELEPNLSGLSAVVSACGKGRQSERALDLVDRCEGF